LSELNKPDFTLDGWQVLSKEGVLRRNGELQHLEPKVMEVLVYFVSRQGEVITREELERDVWHGAIVGYDAVTKTVIKLRKALNDNAREPRCIITIPKKGYQLITPVVEVETEKEHQVNKPTNHYHLLYKHPVMAIFLLLILVPIFFITLQPVVNHDTAKNIPSVLVLPFSNMDEDKQYDAFVDGITEDIITDLSRLSQLFVFASNTSFRYKEMQIDPKAVKKELNADYLLKGNVRRIGESLRINIQLIDTKTAFNIWAERYDRNVNEVFSIKNELIQRFIKELTVKVSAEEQQQLEKLSTSNLKAYDYFLSGQREQKQRTRETHQQAKDFYRKAIQLDPSYGRAYGSLAVIKALEFRRGWTDTPMETLDRALALAEQAVLLNGNVPHTHWSLGFVHLMRKEYKQAEKASAKAVEISPNYADGYGLQAFINNHLGNAKIALKQITKGMKLNPYYSWDYPMNYGWANYMLGDYEKAIPALEQAQARNENVIHIKLLLAASYVKAGRQDDAEWVVEAIRSLNPNTSLSHTNHTFAIADTKLKKMLLDDLRMAGLPE